MRVMMLGGGTNQLCAIKRIKERGDTVIVSDYLESSPGKLIADYTVLADTFSYEKTVQAARETGADAVLTVGTDQPVLTAARVAKALGLISGLSPETALAVTNKKYMKSIFCDHRIPTVAYELLSKDTDYKDLESFQYPAVLKPVDSQGQRGIFKVYNPEQVAENLAECLKYSKTGEALLEAYYENQEVTVSGWVKEGKTYILTMTDRVTFSEDEKIGVCVSHEHPSVHIKEYGDTAKDLTEDIVKAFEIENGPIYFQFLIGAKGMVVNEIACRIGGAYEDQFIPAITGFDILDAQLDLVQGQAVSLDSIQDYDFRDNQSCVSVQLFFAQPGQITSTTHKEDMLTIEGVEDFRCHYSQGQSIPKTENASARAGFGLIYGNTEKEIRDRIGKFFDNLHITSVTNENLVIRGSRGNRHND